MNVLCDLMIIPVTKRIRLERLTKSNSVQIISQDECDNVILNELHLLDGYYKNNLLTSVLGDISVDIDSELIIVFIEEEKCSQPPYINLLSQEICRKVEVPYIILSKHRVDIV